jgi:hypothetical protein
LLLDFGGVAGQFDGLRGGFVDDDPQGGGFGLELFAFAGLSP